MSKALWSLVFFGILTSVFVSCSNEDDDDGELPADYRFQTVFRSSGEFTTSCDGDTLISNYTQVRVFYDWNRNGPDESDSPVTPSGSYGIPEGMYGSYVDFFVDSPLFISPVFSCSGAGGEYPRYYLRMYAGVDGTTQWTSPTVPLIRHGGPPDTVDIPFDEWTCRLSDESAPQCHVGYSQIEFYRDGNEDDSRCLGTCDGMSTIIAFSEADSARAEIVPIMRVTGSCDSSPSAAYDFNPASWTRESYGNWWTLYGFTGLHYGKFTVSWLDSVPCARIELLEITRTDSTTLLNWQTEFEIGCANFEIWVHSISSGGQGLPQFCGTIAAERVESGTAYSFVTLALPAQYSYEFSVIAVDDSSAKYPCIRQKTMSLM